VPNDRTTVTELATALGMLTGDDAGDIIGRRPTELRVDPATWDRLGALWAMGGHRSDFASSFANGRAFLASDDGLAGRAPRVIEWTGGRRPPGDEVAPIDLRVDHVYLVSCKYLSDNIQSPSPARLFDGLLATSGEWDRRDWYEVTAPDEYQALYAACREASGLTSLPETAVALSGPDRRALRQALPGRRYPEAAQEAYRALCAVVSERSARRWRERLAQADAERVLWRLLRIGNAPYFLLGADAGLRLALRIDTPWDWHRQFELRGLEVTAGGSGQPRVNWAATYRRRRTRHDDVVAGHVEVRWSHGKFSQPPEAKVYLDTPADRVPGYHRLGGQPAESEGEDPGGPQASLW